MSAFERVSPALRGGLTAGAIVIAMFGLWLWKGASLAPVEVSQETAGDAPAPAGESPVPEQDVAALDGEGAEPPPEPAETAAAEAPSEPEVSAVPEAPAVPLPNFDIVRIEPDGSAVIAGNSAPGDTVTLLLDGGAVAEAQADGQGAFVAFANLRPGTDPRVLTLLAKGPGGERRSEASVIVAPAAVVAQAPVAAASGDIPADPPAEEMPLAVAALSDGAATQGDDQASSAPVDKPSVDDPAPVEVPGAMDGPSAADAPVASANPATETATTQRSDASGGATPQVTDQANAEPELGDADAAAPEASPPDATAEVETDAGATVARIAPPPAEAPEAPQADMSVAAEAPEPPVERPQVAAAESVSESPTAPAAAPVVDTAAPQLLVASDEGLRVLQPSSTAAEVPLRVETIGYSDGGVTLSGRGTGGPSDLRIYLDNDPVAVAPLDTDGTWTAELQGIIPGTYTLRVDQLAQDGKVTRRFETPFLRETEEALARSAPAETAPEGLSVSVITVQPGYSLWAIATDRYGDGMSWHKVLDANRSQIRDPDLIYPGQVFDLPD